MDYIYLSVIVSSISTVAIILTYIYLYLLYRERYMGIWTLSWLILLSRYAMFDSGLLPWRQSEIGLVVYQMLIIISAMMYVWGTHIFIERPLNKKWLLVLISVSLLTVVLNSLFSSLVCKLMFPIYIGCFTLFWIGLTFIRHVKLHGYGHLITGYAHIAWSFLNIAAPLTLNNSWLLPWAYSVGGVLRMTIAMGTLMVYFEKTRTTLAVQEKQYRFLTENAVDVIYYYQLLPERKIKYISPAVLTLTGYTPEEYYADNSLIFKLIHPDDHSLLNNFIHNLPNSTELPLTLRLIQKNQTTLWLEQKCSPIYNKTGRLIALEGIIRDITTRKKLEQIVVLFDRMNMVGTMAVTVAHEIRNPMTTIRGYLQIMERKEKYSSDKNKFSLMIEEIDRANTIITEYLSLSQQKVSDFQTCSLNHIVESLFPLIQANATSASVSATLALTNIPELLLDENQVRQLLLNLTRNSMEAMPTGGNLIIRTYQEDHHVILSVSDQGSGIPAHVLNNLGTPFITTKATGTGLGLPICYQITRRHNGSIKIDTSEKGTTFYIYFTR